MPQLDDGPLALEMSPEEFRDRVDAMMGIPRAHPSEVIAAVGNGRAPKPPLSTRGYVEDAAFDSLLADMLETVREVAWPTSVQTYQLMRHDAKLSAILDGYSLQIERATWQLDGAGCRPEVVKLVADDLDLTVKDKDEPGAARTRGVSWPDHLQAALTMLVFGHSGFELQAEMADGKARLVGLWDRPQHTIEQIHVEPKTGAFNGISQELALGPFDKAEIGPERLAWYAHRREGAQWFGRSILRPAYAPWLFKREMMRAAATANRRFAMGIPTVEWAKDATPSPQQFSEAQKAITAARVGDTAGVTMPPGAMMRLVGLSGSTPDTMAFVQWLDQQMSTMALMGHLDLGQTATGSRALGETFIDSWLLALESIGKEIADAATRQVAARIVQWNWGKDEPVPRVTVSGIGSRREVTAQSLQLLLQSGALAPYPELSAWVAREYRLPDPPPPEQPVQVQSPGVPDGEQETEPEPEPEPEELAEESPEVAAAAAVEVPQQSLPLPPGFRPARPPEKTADPASASKRTPVRYEQPALIDVQAQTEDETAETEQQRTEREMRQVEQDHTAALAALLAAWPLLAAPIVPPLAQAASEAAAAGTVATLATLTVGAEATAAVVQRIRDALAGLAGTSAGRARAESAAQGVDLAVPDVDTGRLDALAEATAELLIGGYRSAAARAAMNATSPDVDPEDVAEAVRNATEDLTRTATSQQRGQQRGFVAGELAAALQAAIHAGRAAAFRALEALGVPFVLVADETLDPNTCGPCAAIHRTEFDTVREAFAAYSRYGYRQCEGRRRCRGQLRARIRRDREGVPGA